MLATALTSALNVLPNGAVCKAKQRLAALSSQGDGLQPFQDRKRGMAAEPACRSSRHSALHP